MDLNWLRDFECLSRSQNFTRAADERNITQSAFSRRIKALENWVGLPLINRATYPVQLTDAGKQFLPVASAAVSQLSEARQVLRDADRGESRFVRFSVLHTISVHYLANRIEAMQRTLTDMRTRVISDALGSCCELLVEGAVDIMLCYDHNAVAPMIDEADFERKDLYRDRLLPVAAAAKVEETGWSLDAAGSEPIPYLAYERSTFLGLVVEQTIGQMPFNAEIIYVDGLVEAIKQRLLAGSGFAWMPETAIHDDLENGDLVRIGGEQWIAPLMIVAYADPSLFDAATTDVWHAL